MFLHTFPQLPTFLNLYNCRNHPVIKDDGLLAVFLTEPSFDAWRKNTLISYDEESVGKRVDQIEEMSIPSDLEDKLAYVTKVISLPTKRTFTCALQCRAS